MYFSPPNAVPLPPQLSLPQLWPLRPQLDAMNVAKSTKAVASERVKEPIIKTQFQRIELERTATTALRHKKRSVGSPGWPDSGTSRRADCTEKRSTRAEPAPPPPRRQAEDGHVDDDRLLRACRAAGCPGRLFHDLRRTAVRNLERAGVPRSIAMKITGHKTEAVYRRYAIVNEADVAEGLERLDSPPFINIKSRGGNPDLIAR